MSFSSLPYELRSQIWSLAIEPRRITGVHRKMSDAKFTKRQRNRGKDILYETTSTPLPAVMHACHESRKHAPYKRAFTAGTEPRWTWVNFELDVFCVSSLYDISDIVSHRSEVRRLHVRTDEDRDWYESVVHFNVLRVLLEFVNLQEVQVVLEPGPPIWAHVYRQWCIGGCPQEGVTFLDEASGLVLTGPQLQVAYDWRFRYSFDSAGNPPRGDELHMWIQSASRNSWRLTMSQMHEID